MFLWWPSTKIVQAVWIHQKTWPPGGQGLFSLYIYIKKNFKNLFVRNRYTEFNVIWQEWWPSTKIVQAFMIRQKTWPPEGAGLTFRMYLVYIENFKNLLVRNHWTDFNIILQKCFFGDPLPKLFKPFGFVKKHGRQGAGLNFPIYIYYIENFKNLLVRNHWTDFHIILHKCSFGDPLPRLFKPFRLVKNHGRQGAGLIFPIYLYWKM